MSHRIEYILFRLVKRFVLLLPLKSAQRLGATVGSISYMLARKRRTIALENLQNAFPEKPLSELKTIAHRAFQSYGITLMEFFWFPNFTKEKLQQFVAVPGLELCRKYYEQGKGVVVVSGHVGNWELNALALGVAGNFPASIVVQTQNNRLVDQIINKDRSMFGNKIVPMGISVREIIRALHDGAVVALAADQSGPEEGPYINFFGTLTTSHQGPAVFALRMKSPMLLVLLIRKPNGSYESMIQEVPSVDLRGDSEENVRELTQRYTTMLEYCIRQHPDQWLWMHRRWKHSLTGERKSLRDGVYSGV